MADAEERMRILEMIDSGRISAEEGLRLLQILGGEDEGEEQAAQLPAAMTPAEELDAAPSTGEVPQSGEEQLHGEESNTTDTLAGAFSGEAEAELSGVPDVRSVMDQEQPVVSIAQPAEQDIPGSSEEPRVTADQPPHALPEEARKWRRFWVVPMWIGVVVVILGGVLMFVVQRSANLGFWFACSTVPFILGLLILVLAWQTRNAPWLHLRVQQKPGERPQRIALSFPIPVRPTVWFLRTFGNRIQGLEDTSLDEIVLALGETAHAENPVYIQVDEGEDGEKVEVYIG